MVKRKRNTLQLVIGGILLGLGAVSLFIALSTTWLNRTVLDQTAFVEIAKHELAKQENRDAIAGLIVNEALGNYPLADQLVGARAAGFVSGLLNTDIAARTFNFVANNTYSYVTKADRKDLVIDLGTMSGILVRIVAVAGGDSQKYAIPSKITLLKADALPDISGYIRSMVFVEFLAWIATVVSFVGYFFMTKSGRIKRFYRAAVTVLGVAVFGLFAGPLVPRAIAGFIESLEPRELVVNLTNAFLGPFYTLLWTVIIMVLIVVLLVAVRRPALGLIERIAKRKAA